MGENNDLASDDAFSGEAVPQGDSKQNKEIASGKKTATKKAAKVTAEPAKVEKPDPGKSAVKKVSPKKAVEAKAEVVEPKPVKAKKAVTKKIEYIAQPENEPGPKIKRQAKKPLLQEVKPGLQTQDFLGGDADNRPQETKEDASKATRAFAEPVKQASSTLKAETSIDTPAASSAEPY